MCAFLYREFTARSVNILIYVYMQKVLGYLFVNFTKAAACLLKDPATNTILSPLSITICFPYDWCLITVCIIQPVISSSLNLPPCPSTAAWTPCADRMRAFCFFFIWRTAQGFFIQSDNWASVLAFHRTAGASGKILTLLAVILTPPPTSTIWSAQWMMFLFALHSC